MSQQTTTRQMAINQTNHPAGLEIDPRYQKIEKDPGTNIIIIDDVIDPGVSEAHTEVNRTVAWLKIETDYQVSVLAGEPSGLNELNSHHPWNRLRLFATDNETFVVEYAALPMNHANQQSVTGYQLGSPSDALYVKIDQNTNMITLYEGGKPS